MLRARDKSQEKPGAIVDRFAALEQRHGGRLGVAILDAARSTVLAHRGDERFPLCSTYKLLVAACVLSRIDQGRETLDRRVFYGRDTLVTYSPVTEKHAGEDGMTIAALCDAAITLSDNTAGNLLLDAVGGPAALTAYFRSLGDSVTRMDRYETALNSAIPGDARDTTTPLAMVRLIEAFVSSDKALSAHSRELLVKWMVDCRTGGERLRGGAPQDWTAGDKTGTGDNNSTNDVAVFWPPGRHPIVVSAYYTGAGGTPAERSAVLREVGRIAATL
ncbi:MAG: class A beta-lactamase [Beijerinckiaceae bacterium]|nr:class A beta-lactamase [Beijerinckiaceae bacterium]